MSHIAKITEDRFKAIKKVAVPERAVAPDLETLFQLFCDLENRVKSLEEDAAYRQVSMSLGGKAS